MSTSDVPGARAANADVLAMGCWAEHDDGSLILVESCEVGRVVYSVFDVAADPPQEYRHAMTESAFKAQFSWPNDHDRWTWHDKTPFPWDTVMGALPPGSRYTNVGEQLNAAARIADRLRLDARDVDEEKIRRRVGSWGRVRDRIQRGIDGLRR